MEIDPICGMQVEETTGFNSEYDGGNMPHEAGYQPATHLALAMEGAGGGEIAIENEGEPLTQIELGRVFAFCTVNQLSVIS